MPPQSLQPLESCPKCQCSDLFIRRDFPQKLGLLIVIAAAVTFLILSANPHRFYLGVYVLLGALGCDVLLFLFVPKITVCYRCRAEFRGVPLNPKHEGYELAIGEKYRQEQAPPS